MSFDLRRHTADVAVAATGSTLDETFAAVAAGLTAAHCDDVPPDVGDCFSIRVAAESKEALLFDYLDELIYERDVLGVLPTDHEVQVNHESHTDSGGGGAWVLEASARGVPFDAVDAREIKAVTYSEMELVETDSGWRAYVVFDV